MVIEDEDSPAALVVRTKRAREMLDCGRSKLQRMIQAREIRAYSEGGVLKIEVASIHEYIKRRLDEASARRG